MTFTIRELFSCRLGVTNWDGGLYSHNGIRIDLQDQLNDSLNVGSIKEILLRVVIGGSSDYYEVCILVGCFAIKGGGEVEVFLCQVLLDVFILDGALLLVNLLYFLRDDVYCYHFVVLCQKCCYG